MDKKKTLRRICVYAVSNGVPYRSFSVAVVVGTVLNLINQGDAVLGSGPINWVKIVLTYLVPYGVATFGAVSVQLRQSGNVLMRAEDIASL